MSKVPLDRLGEEEIYGPMTKGQLDLKKQNKKSN